MIFKNVANQKLPLYLQDSSGNPKTGEAANITAYISVDGGTPQTVTGVTEIGGGFYYITPSQAQTNGHLLTWWGTHATYICRGGAAFTSDAYTKERAQALDNLDAAVSSRLAGSAYTAVDVDEQAIADAVASQLPTSQVVVQPIVARALLSAGDGGVITGWRYAKLRASWLVTDSNLTGHDLRVILYTDDTKIQEYSTGEITITYQAPNTLIQLTGIDAKTPDPGRYRYVLRDQTIDAVLLAGICKIYDAPDAEAQV